MRTVGIWTCAFAAAIVVGVLFCALAGAAGTLWLFPCGCMAGAAMGSIFDRARDASVRP